MNKKLVEIKKIAPGMVKIESPIEGLLTLDRYLNIARDLLENGLDVGNEKLKDVSSPNMIENVLLYQELEKGKTSDVKEVVFSINGQDYIVNLKNIDKIVLKKSTTKPNAHMKAIR